MGGDGFASHLGETGWGFDCKHGRISPNLFGSDGFCPVSFAAKLVVGSRPMPIDCEGKTGFGRHRRTTDVQCTLSTGFLFCEKLEQHKTCVYKFRFYIQS